MGCLPDARHPMGRAGAKGDICFSLPVVRQRYQPYGRQGIAPRARDRPLGCLFSWRDSQSSAPPPPHPQPHQHDQNHKHHRPRCTQRLPSQQPPTSALPPDSPATKTPSRRSSRRAAPTFTWVMFRVSRLWWPSPTPSRNNGSRSLTWSRACRLTLPPVMRVPLCRVCLIGSSSLRSPQPSEPTSLTSTRLASPYRTSAPASTSRKTPSSAFASRLASLNGSAASMSLKATRPNQCTPLASPS